MPGLLIVFGTTDGHTSKVAEFIQQHAKQLNFTVDCFNAKDNPPSPESYDAVILAASMHITAYQKPVKKYMKAYSKELNSTLSAFISVSMTAGGTDQEAWDNLKEHTTKTLQHAGWNPNAVEYVAGALLYLKYNWFIRLVMRDIARKADGATDTSKNHEYTDWEALKSFLTNFLSHSQ